MWLQMSELKSLKEAYKFDKWDLFFGNEEINKCKGFFVLRVVSQSPTFESWIKEERKKSTYTKGFFKCVWKEAK